MYCSFFAAWLPAWNKEGNARIGAFCMCTYDDIKPTAVYSLPQPGCIYVWYGARHTVAAARVADPGWAGLDWAGRMYIYPTQSASERSTAR